MKNDKFQAGPEWFFLAALLSPTALHASQPLGKKIADSLIELGQLLKQAIEEQEQFAAQAETEPVVTPAPAAAAAPTPTPKTEPTVAPKAEVPTMRWVSDAKASLDSAQEPTVFGQTPAVEPKTPEAPKIEAVKPIEVPKVEAPKIEAVKPVELPKVEAPKIEAVKPVEVPKVEAPKIEAVKPVELPKVEAPKIEAVKPVELPKVEAPKIEAPKPITPVVEVAKTVEQTPPPLPKIEAEKPAQERPRTLAEALQASTPKPVAPPAEIRIESAPVTATEPATTFNADDFVQKTEEPAAKLPTPEVPGFSKPEIKEFTTEPIVEAKPVFSTEKKALTPEEISARFENFSKPTSAPAPIPAAPTTPLESKVEANIPPMPSKPKAAETAGFLPPMPSKPAEADTAGFIPPMPSKPVEQPATTGFTPPPAQAPIPVPVPTAQVPVPVPMSQPPTVAQAPQPTPMAEVEVPGTEAQEWINEFKDHLEKPQIEQGEIGEWDFARMKHAGIPQTAPSQPTNESAPTMPAAPMMPQAPGKKGFGFFKKGREAATEEDHTGPKKPSDSRKPVKAAGFQQRIAKKSLRPDQRPVAQTAKPASTGAAPQAPASQAPASNRNRFVVPEDLETA